jgi:hypothetical protein
MYTTRGGGHNKMRKTIKITELIQRVNEINELSADDDLAGRITINVFLEQLLHEHDCYAGFTYVTGCPVNRLGIPRSICSQSRHVYCIHASLVSKGRKT